MIASDSLDLFDSLGGLADLASQASDLDQVLDRAVSIIAQATGADSCLVAQPPVSQSTPTTIVAAFPAQENHTELASLATWIAPIASRVSETNQPVLVQTPETSDPELRAMLSARGLASAVAVPIIVQHTTPLIVVACSTRTNGFANADLGFMSSVASILSLANALHDGHSKNDHQQPATASRAELQSNPDTPGLGGWELDLTSGALHWTETMYQLFGLSRGETTLTQELFDSLVDPRDRERLRNSLRESRLNEQPGVIEYRTTRADGSTRWIRQEHDLVANNPEAPHMVGTVHDVTLQHEAMERMRRTDERLRAVLNVSEIGIAIVEDDGRAVYRNSAYTTLLGYTSEQMENFRLEDLAIEPDRGLITELRRKLRGGDAHAATDRPITFAHPDGSLKQLLVSVSQSEAGGRTFRVVNLQDVTARVTAQHKAEEEETRFQRIFETASSGFLILGPDGTPQTANQAFLDIYGLELDQLQDRPPQDFVVSQQQASDVEECIGRHLQGEEGSCDHIFEIRRHSDGALRSVSITCQSIVADDEVRGVLAEFTDLTDTMAARQALEESERRLTEAQQVAALGHWEWDVGASTITASEQITQLLGSGADSARFYDRYLEILAPEDRDRVQAASEAAFAGGAPFDQRYTVLSPGAEPTIVHEVIRIEFDSDGDPVRAFGTVQDVTIRVAAERALAESESRLQAMFDASPNGISFFSDRNTPPLRNRAFAEMLGYQPSELEARPVSTLLPSDEDRNWVREMWERVEHGEPAGDLGIARFLHKDGHIVDAEIRVAEVEVDGSVVGRVADVRDVTTELASRQALEESEARARLIFNSASSGMSLIRLNGAIELANQAFCDIIGTTADQVTNLRVHRIINRQDAPAVFALFRARLSGEFSAPPEALVRLARLDDGRLRTLRVDVRPFIEQGTVAGMLADVRDVTDHTETLQALAESQARLRRAQANAHIGGWELDIAASNLRWSDELYQLFGQEPGELPPTIETVLQGTHEEDRTRFVDAFERAEEANDTLDVRIRFSGADDVQRIIWTRGDLIRDPDGKPLRWEGTSQDITDLVQAQDALAKSEARLKAAQASAKIGSWSRDPRTNETYWSDELSRLLGFEPGAMEPGRDAFRSFVHPDDVDRYALAVADLDNGIGGHETLARFLGADGIERLLRVKADLVRDHNGTPVLWEGTAQDVTEQAAAQQALAESEARLNLAQSLSHVGSWGRHITRGDGYWSDEFFRLLGYEPGAIEPSPRNFRKHIHPDDQAIFEAATRDMDDSYDVQVRFVGADGVERMLAMHGELTRNEDGEPLRWDGTAQDVTELEQTQHALAEREEFLRTTLEAVRSGVMVVNPDRKIMSANTNASQIMGYEPDEFLDAKLEEVVHGEDLALMLGRFAARVRGESGPERTIVRAQRKDGTAISLDVRGAPLVQSGELRGIVVDFRDVTEELAVQHRLEDTATRLRTLFETVRSGLMVVGPDLVPLTCNEALASIIGSSVDEILSQSIDTFLLPEERQIVAESIEARMRDEDVPGRIPSAIVRTDGARREVDVRSTPFVVDGKPIGILCELRDVTEELALQEEVQDTAERLNTVFETVSTGLIIVGLDQRPLTVNQALCDILGYSRDQLMEKTFTEISHPDDVAFLLDRFAHRIAGGSATHRQETRALKADGTVIHVDISAEPFRIGGEIVGVLGEVRDITEALALQREVENTAERLNTIFESVSTGLTIIAPDRRPLTVNQALCDISGYSREELLARSFEQSLHPDETGQLLERFADRLSGELDRRDHYQTRLVRKDGATINISVSSEPFHIGGRFVGILVEVRDVTEEILLQRQVQDTADRLNNVFESVSTGLLVIGPDRLPVTVNQALCEITGYSQEHLLGAPFDALIHHDDLPMVLQRFATRLAGDSEPSHLQARTIRQDGQTIVVDISAEPFRVSGGIVGVLAEVRDITEDLALQRRVQDTADRLNNVFESVATGLAVIGPDRVPQTLNQAFRDILGRSEEDLLSQPFDRLIHPDDLDLILERTARRFAGEEVIPHHIQIRVLRGDGETIDIDLSAVPFIVAGETIGLLVEIRDITEELSLQALLTESAEQINTILEATPDAIVVADDNDIILRVNAATETIFGAGPEELIGQPVAELVGGPDRAPHSTYVEHYKQTGLPSTEGGLVIGNFREAVGRRLDGTDFPAELAIAETELNDGRKLFVAAIRDITERKQAEEQLRQLNAALETRSRERQALVQQLLSAQEEERRTVAYEIHDGPAQQLAAAQMFLEAFAFDQNIDLEHESSEHFQRAKSYLDSGLTETRRIMSGLRPALLDDLGLADALHQLLNEIVERAGITLELNAADLTAQLSPAIEITLYRIAQEAAGNALKHSGTNNLSVELKSDRAAAYLTVTDHGRGFNPRTTQGPANGRRYGLVGMRERVELLEGTFEIDSAEGRGTTIKATIPLNQESE
jgi:PAS domain S-box-containing protein